VEHDDALIAYSVQEAEAVITLNDPDRRNALSTAMIGQLRKSLDRAVSDDAVRVIVIDHNGPVFCAGADLRESAAAQRAEDLPAARLADLLADMCEAPKPIAVAASGAVRGGGMGLLAAADVAVCEESTVFAFSEVKLGVVPAVIAPVVARKLTPGKMRQLFLTGAAFDVEEARHCGLVSYYDSDSVLDEAVADLLAGGPGAQAGIKQLTAAPNLREELRKAAAVTAEYFFSDEGREGVRSFIEKRPASWVG
jgi:methylglutaconyl-CoA hydratase